MSVIKVHERVLCGGLCSLLSLFVFFVSALSPLNAWAENSDSGSSFTARLINIEAPVNETFRYQTTLQNNSEKAQRFELKSDVPEGWRVVFKAMGSQLTSIKLEPGKSESISVEVNPAYGAKPDQYEIPVHAVSGDESLELELEAVVEGAYDLELSTPTGRLSGEITEGEKAEIHLKVKNTGSLPLNEISLSSKNPPNWEVTFSPSELNQLAPGKTADVVATLTVPDKTLAGDYVTKFTAKNASSTSAATYRMTVKTSMLSGGIGVLVIFLAIGFVIQLIRKFGRR
ncbi:COG1470 family protein [Echinicola shivajiensis]|uniref:COG1470 family protein n=1 Tax=Echinicola shivajiensis TaxID=1035916 RepID=UPI001BFC2286|nr:NEW3 domain-containing protein [Echinicola shivajiensis]